RAFRSIYELDHGLAVTRVAGEPRRWPAGIPGPSWSVRRSDQMTRKTIMVIGEVVAMMGTAHDHTWSVAEAKARLSELLDLALNDGPQAITRRGREIAVVVSTEEWHRKTSRSGSLAEFLAGSPLRGSDLDIERVDAPARDAVL
ncbi:MAG TPA: type II toxin-antitoxin system Phd/YefM family antitoxin, partial [Solirubrobacteraceae bacterium]|nr:type II toxin-antitoxin system Phd/YefM family antitoxin [Solirubrobacteraceae bacterium]